MSGNVAEALAGRSLSLYEKLGTNKDLTNTMMAFIGRIYMMCMKESKPLQGVQFSDVTESGGEFRFRISFTDLPVYSAPTIWTASGNLGNYVEGKARSLARIVDNNQNFVRGVRNLVEAVDRFCERKQMKFHEFKIKKAIVNGDNVFVLKSGTQTLDRWGR